MTTKGLVLADFNTKNLDAMLVRECRQHNLRMVQAPFGQVHALLLDEKAACWREQPDFTIVWTRPDAVLPNFRRALQYAPVDRQKLLAEVDQFATLLLSLPERTRSVFVPTWTLPGYERGLGILDLQPGLGPSHLLLEANLRLCQALQDQSAIYVLNAARWLQNAGPAAFHPKLWYFSKTPFTNTVFQAAAIDIEAALQALGGRSRKLIVLDLDDTLWGGIVGEIGWQKLCLGGHDPDGEALVDFQRALKGLTQRGILLGIVSKNEESVALEAVQYHPEMVLRLEDFAGWRINWSDKATNIAELAAELRLGLESVVFIDDNPAEQARVRETLPDVLVPQWPTDKTLYPKTLAELTCFDSLTLSNEDRDRTRMYREEQQREASKAQVGSLDDWLRTLDLEVHIEPLSLTHLSRATQLLNKTNQMNLVSRRLTERALWDWAQQPNHRIWIMGVEDRFGQQGLTGLLGVRIAGSVLYVTDFLVSCRVMGRRLEEALLALAVQQAQAFGCERVLAELVPTQRNQPCQRFFKQSGWSCDDEHCFSWNVETPYPVPQHIHVNCHQQQFATAK